MFVPLPLVSSVYNIIFQNNDQRAYNGLDDDHKRAESLHNDHRAPGNLSDDDDGDSNPLTIMTTVSLILMMTAALMEVLMMMTLSLETLALPQVQGSLRHSTAHKDLAVLQEQKSLGR